MSLKQLARLAPAERSPHGIKHLVLDEVKPGVYFYLCYGHCATKDAWVYRAISAPYGPGDEPCYIKVRHVDVSATKPRWYPWSRMTLADIGVLSSEETQPSNGAEIWIPSDAQANLLTQTYPKVLLSV